MKRRVSLSAQAEDFLRRLPPAPRRNLRLALRGLEMERGDLKGLEEDLAGFWRLRVGPYRVIFHLEPKQVRCDFIERRSVVYEVFGQLLRERVASGAKPSTGT